MATKALATRDAPGAIATTDATDYAIMMTDPAELRSAIQAATNGQRIDAFQLDMVKVPSGGLTVWTIPDIIEGERIDKKIEGIVVLQRTIRSWWRTGFDERGGAGTQPPDCSSQDGIWGIGHPDGHPDLVETDAPGFAYEAFDADGKPLNAAQRPLPRYACEACPLAQFGSGKNQRGQACRQNRLVFLLTQDSALPIVIKVPPSSLKLVQGFLLRLSGKAIPPHGAVLAFGLRKTQNSGGIDYSEIVPEFVARLEDAAVQRIVATAEALKPSLLGTQAVADL
jgi:hypothetical protein